MATIVTLNPSRAVDLNGFAIPGARATFYNSGTTTPRTVYSDPDCQLPHTQPVVADGAGVFPPIYDDSQSDLRVSVTDASGAMLPGYPIDPAVKTSTSMTGASAVQFNPTPEIPVQTVQAAIERVQANIVDPIADFGLGVTGNATLLADIDDKAVASGFYRYDNTTAGTFPANLTPPTDGFVLIFRQNAANVLQLVLSTRRIFRRRLQANSWTAWSWLVDSLDVADNATWAAGVQSVPYVISPATLKAAVAAAVNASGAAPIYACRAWANIEGSTTPPAIRAGGNVSSVTVSSDVYTVTFATAMEDADYAVVATAKRSSEGWGVAVLSQTAGSFTMQVKPPSFGSTLSPLISIAVFR